MTVPASENQGQENQQNSKEVNFRLQERAMQDKYERILAQERSERERLTKELEARQKTVDEEEEDNEPYIDHKKLKKEQAKFGQQLKQETQGEIHKAVQMALHEERKQNWMKNNPDFYDVMKNAERFAQMDPELAETILEMPEGFERQKLVYKNIKALGLHKPEQKAPSIQDKIDANRRSPFYQPSGVGSAPYSSQSDFSQGGQKQGYDKMQELKNRLRLG